MSATVVPKKVRVNRTKNVDDVRSFGYNERMTQRSASKELQWIPVIKDADIASGNELERILSLDFLDEEPTKPCAPRTMAEEIAVQVQELS